MTEKFKELYNTYPYIINEFYKYIEDDQNNSKKENINLLKTRNKDILLKEFEGLSKIPGFSTGFEDFLLKIFKSFKKELVNSSFHKRGDRKKIFNLIDFLNKDLKTIIKKAINKDISDDFLYSWIFLVVYRSAFFLRNDNSMLNLRNKEVDLFNQNNELMTCNDRHKLIEKIEDELEKIFIILANAFKITLTLENLNEWIVVFVMFLEDNDILTANDKDIKAIKSKKNNFVFTTKYSFKYETEIKKEEDLKFFYNSYYDLHINDIGIIIFENNFYSSNRIRLKKNFQISENIFKIQEIIKENSNYKPIKNKKKNPTFVSEKDDLNSINDEKNSLFKKFVLKTTDTKRYVDWNLFEFIINTFHIKKIKKYNLNLKSSYKDFHDILFNYSYIDSNDNKNDFKLILELLYLKIFFENYKEKDFFYSLFFFDFRGRLYFKSLIYITNFKLSRFYTFYGYYSIDQIENIIEQSKKCKSYKLLNNYVKHIETTQNLENLFHQSYFTKNEIDREFKINILISELVSLGVIFKNEILKNGKYEINLEEFLNLGIEKLRIFKKMGLDYFINIDQEDFLKVRLYCLRLIEDRNWFKMEKSSFDSSCSGHQIRNYINSYSDIKNYSFINLAGNDKFIDYYSFIIQQFIDYIKNDKNLSEKHQIFKNTALIDEIFKRSILKKSLMTVEYNCAFITFLEYIKINLKEKNLNLYVEVFEKKKKTNSNDVTGILFEFYNYCKNTSFDKENSNLKIIIEGLVSNNFQINYIDNFKASFAFFSKIKGDKRITYYSKIKKNKNNTSFKRFTKPVEVYNSVYNEKLSKDKLMPHFIHGCDGVIVRRVSLLNEFIYSYETIHDEYWIPAFEQFLFKDLMNYIFKLKLFKEEDSSDYKSYTKEDPFLGEIYCFFIIL